MSDAKRRKHDDRVAVGVTGAVVMELDTLRPAGENRHAVPVHLVRQKGRLFRPRRDFIFLHVRLGVLLCDDLDRSGEEIVAAGVVGMGMRLMM